MPIDTNSMMTIYAPPSLAHPNDRAVRVEQDMSGNPIVFFQSGASYWEHADGSWEYADQYGATYSGAADGSYCDAFGNCAGAWSPGILDALATTLGISPQAAMAIVLGGGLLILLTFLISRKR